MLLYLFEVVDFFFSNFLVKERYYFRLVMYLLVEVFQYFFQFFF